MLIIKVRGNIMGFSGLSAGDQIVAFIGVLALVGLIWGWLVSK